MLVHLISRPLTHVSHLPRSGVSFIAEGCAQQAPS